MKSVTMLNLRRSAATFGFAAAITLASVTEPSLSVIPALLAPCILGAAQGTGAAGLFLALGGMGLKVFPGAVSGCSYIVSPEGRWTAGIFAGAFLCGLIAGIPSESERKFSLKNWFRCILACAVFFAVFHLVSWNADFSMTEIALTAGAAIASALLRPFAARFLYPREKLSEEVSETLERISGKNNRHF